MSQSRLNGQASNFEEMDTTSSSCLPRSRSNPPSPSDPDYDPLADPTPLIIKASADPSRTWTPPPSSAPGSDRSSPVEIPFRGRNDSPPPWLNVSDSEPAPGKQSSPMDIPKARNKGKGRGGGGGGLPPFVASDSVSGSVGRRRGGKRNGRKN